MSKLSIMKGQNPLPTVTVTSKKDPKLKAYQVNLGYADDTNKLVVVKSFFVNNEKDAKHYILRWISSNE